MIKVRLLSFYNSGEAYCCKYSLASLRLAAYVQDLDEIEISIETVDCANQEDSVAQIIERLNLEQADLIGISAYIWTWEMAKQISHGLMRNNGVTVLIGGPEVINRSVNDWFGDEIFVYGEGEKLFRELCLLKESGITNKQLLEMGEISNAKRYGKKYIVEKNCDIFYKSPIFFDEFFKKLKITDYPTDFSYYEATRGCPYKCGYCGHKVRSKIASFDDDFINAEIEYIGKLGIKEVFIIDPILGGTPKKGKRILENFIKYAPDTELTAYLRPEYLDDEYLEILSRSNIKELRIGVQTVNENVPRWIRDNDINKILNTLPKLTETGIGWRAELIVGLPGDNMDGLKNSIKFILKEVHPTFIHAYHLTVLPETELYSMVDNQGDKWIKIDPVKFRALESYSYSDKEMIEMVRFASMITALYNSYAYKIENKTLNNAPDYEKLEKIVNDNLFAFQEDKFLHYSECVDYWKHVKQYST